MRSISKIILTILISFLILAGSASAFSYSDADGDGVCEPGEEITFVGDDTYTDENGIEHTIQGWYWDFESDGFWDTSGKIVTHTFPAEGQYRVTLYEHNGDGWYIIRIIETKNNNPEGAIDAAITQLENMIPTGDHKIDKEINKAIEDLKKAKIQLDQDKLVKGLCNIAKAIKHLMKAQKYGADTQEVIDDLVEFVKETVDEYLENHEIVCKKKKYVKKARKHYEKAHNRLNDEKYDKAVKEFKKVCK